MTPDSWLDTVEKISRMLSIAAIPVVIAIGGWLIQRQLQNQSIRRDYVQLALSILQNPDPSRVSPEIREWAVELQPFRDSVLACGGHLEDISVREWSAHPGDREAFRRENQLRYATISSTAVLVRRVEKSSSATKNLAEFTFVYYRHSLSSHFVGGVFLLCFHYLVQPFWGR